MAGPGHKTQVTEQEKMKTPLIISTLAAALLTSAGISSYAQAPSPHAKASSDATGSGKDTGMNVQSGISGNGGGGVGTVASPAAIGASAGKTGASKPKKSAKRSKKHRASSAAR